MFDKIKKLGLSFAIAALVVTIGLGVDPSQKSNATPTTTEIANRITALTGLLPEEIDAMYAAEQRIDMVLIASDITIPIVVEPRTGYLLVRVAATQEWIRVLIDQTEWDTDFRPYLEAQGVPIHEQPVGTIDQSTPAQEAAAIAAAGSISGEAIANIVLYGSPAGPSGSPAPVPQRHVEPDPGASSVSDRIGTIEGHFRVNESGAATYSIPIAAPAGTGGVAPEISLSYSSASSNGIAGHGWSLGGLSAISRCRSTLGQDNAAEPITWTNSDRFCLDGQRLILASGAHGAANATYRNEIDDGTLVTVVGSVNGGPDYFKVQRSDGSTSYYGESPNSTDTSAKLNNGSGQTLTWSIRHFSDSAGNPIWFDYETAAGAQRISNIKYAYGANKTSPTASHGARINFSYDTRQDEIAGYVAGHLFANDKRLTSIRVYNRMSSEALIRQYNLNYGENHIITTDSLSRLTSVQECVGSTCLPKTVFDWRLPRLTGYYRSSSGFTMANSNHGMRAHRQADINGDGKLDLVWMEASYGGNPNDMNPRLNYATANGGDFVQQAFVGSSPDYCPGTGQKEICFDKINSNRSVKLQVLDFNADGRSDVAVYDYTAREWKIYLSTPQGNGNWKLSGVPLSSPVASGKLFDKDAVFIDVNSDGLVDFLRVATNGLKVRYLEVDSSQSQSSNRYYRLGAEQDFNHTAPFWNTNFGAATLYYKQLQLHPGTADFNGDGQVDFLLTGYIGTESSPCIDEQEGPPPYCGGPWELVNAALVSNSDGTFTKYATFPFNPNFARPQTVDLNSDGLSDIVYSDPQNNHYYRINSGNGTFQAAVSLNESTLGQNPNIEEFGTLVYRTVRASGADDPQFVDWNMDGYPDLTWKLTEDSTTNAQARIRIRYWNPSTRAYDPASTTPLMPLARKSKNEWVMFADVNGDGVPDMVRFNMDAQGEVTAHEQIVSPGSTTATNRAINRIETITNGLGAATYVSYDPLSDTSHYERLNVDTATQVGEFCESESGLQFCVPVPITVAQPAAFYGALNGDWDLPAGTQSLGKYRPVLEFSSPIYVVTRVEGDAPAADVLPGNVDNTARSAIRYYYGEGKIQASGRGMLGFERVKTIDEQTGVETTTFYRQDWPFIGYPRKTEVRSSGGHLLSQSTNDWAFVEYTSNSSATAASQGTAALGSIHPVVAMSAEFDYDLLNDGLAQGALLSETVTSTSYDSAEGNPRAITVTNKNGSGATVKSVLTENEYFDTPGLPLREARISQTVVTTTHEGQEHPSRTSRFTYYLSGNARGLLETETIEPTQSDFTLTTTHSYDQFGNLVRSSTQGGAVTRCNFDTIAYDLRGRYADKTFDCLGRKLTEVTARNKFGLPTQFKTFVDVSGSAVTTDVSYGALGREYFRRLPSGSFTTSYLTTNTTNCPAGTVFKAQATTGGSAAQEECYDKLARPIRTLAQGFDGAWDAQDIEYDRLGRVVFKSERNDLGPDLSLWSRFYYDRLSRPTMTILPDDSVPKVAYSGLSTIYTNALGHTKTEIRNVLGEVTDVYDNLGGRTRFWYDYQGNLRRTEDNAGNATVVVHDALGRKKRIEDPNKGTWTYGYNHFGELTQQTNANGHSVAMTYDGLGRMETRTDTCASATSGQCAGGSLTEGHTVWTYDTAAYGLGQLASVNDTVSNYLRVTIYDSLGRSSETRTTFDGSTYYEKTTYDQFGRVFQVFDAGGDGSFQDSGVQHTYNAAGYLESLGDAVLVDGAPRTTYRRITSMSARGQVTGEVLGNGVITMTQHSPTTGRITSISSNGLGGEVQDLRYHWDSVGNLKYRHEYSGTKSLEENFGYDALNRLQSQQVVGETAVTVTYDTQHIGNITNKSDVGDYTYGGAGPHALTSAGSETYTYDANGNNVGGDGRTIEYTTFDKPYEIAKDGHTVTLAYGPDRSRYRRVDVGANGTTTTRYIGGVEIIDRPNNIRERKRHIAGIVVDTSFHDSGGLIDKQTYYLHSDHLGSLDVMTNTSGYIVSEFSFDAWGQRRDASDWTALSALQLLNFDHSITTRGFTSHEMLDEVGVIHMSGRIYDARLGRFLQADIQVQFPTDSKSHNRYSYAHNNPLAYTDSSGYGIDVFDALKILTSVFIAPICLPCAVAVVSQLSMVQAIHYGASISDALLAGVSSAAMTYMGGNIARGPGFGFNIDTLTFASVGGITSSLQGGKFGHGFISAGAGGLSGAIDLGSGGGLGAAVGRTVVRTVVGGTISEATGGKFANGAFSAAFSSALGEARSPAREPTAEERTYLKLARDVYNPKGQKIDGYEMVGELYVDDDTGLQSALYVHEESGHSVLAFAGTNGKGDWSTNFKQAFGIESEQYTKAMHRAQAMYDSTGGNIHFVGHSLGGGLAGAAAMSTSGSATVFNASGVNLLTVHRVSVNPGTVTHIRGAFDVLQGVNLFTPTQVYGEQVVLGRAGFHGVEGLCKAMACGP